MAGLSRLQIVALSTDALVLGLLILVAMAGVGFARNRRRAGAWAFGIAAGVGIVFIVVNPYGDEGIFRASLFGIPWLVLLGLAAVRKHPWRWGAFALLSVVLLGTYLVAQFGLDESNVVRRADVGALETYIAHAPPGSYYLVVAGEGDIPITLDPALHNLAWDPLWNQLNRYQVEVHSTRRPTRRDFEQLTNEYVQYARTVSGTPARNLFVVYSPTSAAYSVEYGLETTANSVQWRSLLSRARGGRCSTHHTAPTCSDTSRRAPPRLRCGAEPHRVRRDGPQAPPRRLESRQNPTSSMRCRRGGPLRVSCIWADHLREP